MCITGQIYMVIYPLEEEIRQIYGIKYLDVKITAQKQSFVKNVADITRQVASLKREQGATLSCPVKVKLSKTTMETYFDESAKNKLQIEAEVKLPIYIDPGSVSRNVSKNKHRVCNEFAEVCRKELNISTLDVQFDLSPSKEINAERLSATAEVQPLSEKSSRKAQHIRDIQIKEREERFPCVTGILVIHDKMFLVDSADKRDGNQTIKVVDLKTDTIAYALKLDDIPWDLTSVGEEKIAVTFPMKGDVGFYLHSSENPLLFESNIDVGEGCRGIVYANKTLLVSFAATSSERRGRVEVLSLFGEHLKIFENTENDHMYYISQEDEQEYFFVSDFENNHIITMNDNGKILCEYYDVEMPYGIVSDSSGSLFACSSCCKTAVELNLSTGQAHELIKKQYLRQPRCVAFCKETKLMYIGMWKNNFVKVFRLS
ncbi:uncharacterized protein LOC128224331 [Mya arenaria]|uniref:uncharacterized protein LOC128224331 n=1 Tax=Mya arenaria TaxID=6604 RepID=UPI0022E7D909|nr:uncharacterized protein LOC128224331 [Mya arenaria]